MGRKLADFRLKKIEKNFCYKKCYNFVQIQLKIGLKSADFRPGFLALDIGRAGFGLSPRPATSLVPGQQNLLRKGWEKTHTTLSEFHQVSLPDLFNFSENQSPPEVRPNLMYDQHWNL